MDISKFKETEQQYRELKDKLGRGEIDPEYLKKELKKMMVLDENGNYWMIGGKTGKWYVYNGTEWKENSPFQQKTQFSSEYTEPAVETAVDKTVMTIEQAGTAAAETAKTAGAADAFSITGSGYEGSGGHTEENAADTGDTRDTGNKKEYEYLHGYEDDEEPFSLNSTTGPITMETEAPSNDEDRGVSDAYGEEQDDSDRNTICKICKSKISYYSLYCPVCGANRKEAAAPSIKVDRAVVKENELLLASVKITSLIFFLGGLGLIVGVFCGAAFGIFKTLLPEFQPLLPDMLAETRGGIAGGLIFAAVGGIAVFTIFAFMAAVMGIIYNIVAFIFGGIRFKITHGEGPHV